MLRFICGTDESQNLREIYRCAKADAQRGESVFILVPEQYSMYAEAELISALGLSAQNKIQILTFSRLCNLIFSKMGPLRTKYIDKAGKHIMTKRALQLSAKELTFFKRNLGQHGFTGLIQTVISEFKRYGVTPSDLNDAAEKVPDDRLRLKLRDLQTIYAKFNALVDEGHSNSEDNLSLIIPKIQKADFLCGTFYVTFFRSFTPSEYSALGELMKKADICAALSTDKVQGESAVFSSQINTIAKLTDMAKSRNISIGETVFLKDDEDSSPDLKHLKDNYFSYSPKVYGGEASGIHISRPDNFQSEVTLCASLIKRLLREKGYSFNDILILSGNPENYELLIPRIFEEYGITYFFDRKIPLTESPLLRMITAVLEILTYGFSYDRIMRLARSGYFAVSTDEADILENYILAADINHSQWNTRSDWTYNPDQRVFDMDFINCVKAKLLHPVLDLISMFHGRKTVKTICNNLFDWFEKIGLPDSVNLKINQLKESGSFDDAEQLRLVWNSFISVTNQICDYMQDEFSTFREFFELFSSACSELSVGIVPPTQDKVVISPIDMFRSTGSKAVIVLGALDGVFPRDYGTEGLISDAERLMLKEAELTLAPDTFSQQREEQFLIYSVLSTAKEHLFILAPLSDRDGKSLRPSEILLTVNSIFPTLDSRELLESEELSVTESKNAAFHRLAVKLFENDWNLHQLSPLWKGIYDYMVNEPIYSVRIDKLKTMHRRKTENIALTPEMAKQLYGLPLTLSVSKLEKYNACAFSFFMQYGLQAQERLMGGLSSSDTGNILHSVLCDYFKGKSETNADYGSITRDACFHEIAVLVDKAACDTNENLYADSHYYKYMMLRLKNIATSTAWKLINFYARSDFRPTGFEISFGKKGVYPPYELNSQYGQVSLKGFIDRVDSATVDGVPYITITDYKSSERKLDMELAEAGIHFQPMIYANALRRHIPDSQIAGMFYLQMNDPILKFNQPPTEAEWERGMSENIKAHGKILNEPAVINSIDKDFGNPDAIHYIKCDKNSLLEKQLFEEALEKADQKATESADRILSGSIDINPAFVSGFDPCKYCPYGNICLNKE